jgi:hypothetical protein
MRDGKLYRHDTEITHSKCKSTQEKKSMIFSEITTILMLIRGRIYAGKV